MSPKAKGKAKSSGPSRKRQKPSTGLKDPKQSHLYTDDNPSTTLQSTGFKDAETARSTISLVSQRSLTYQWQVINTMYHRAKCHPSMRKADGAGAQRMKDAMAIFRQWLDETYPEAKEKRRTEGREFKPLLSKIFVKKYLDRLQSLDAEDDCRRFAEMYTDLPKGKRLANLLLDDKHPEKEDWEVTRENALMRLKQEREGEGEDGLWNERGGVSEWHLKCIGWAWSPVRERRLPP